MFRKAKYPSFLLHSQNTQLQSAIVISSPSSKIPPGLFLYVFKSIFRTNWMIFCFSSIDLYVTTTVIGAVLRYADTHSAASGPKTKDLLCWDDCVIIPTWNVLSKKWHLASMTENLLPSLAGKKLESYYPR